MKLFTLIAALALAIPGVASARKVTYYSDRDGDGHYVKRTKNVPDRYYSSGSRYYHRPYYGSSYGRSYYGRPHYGYGYGYPSYYYRSVPSVSFTYSSSSPRYYSSPRVYRSSTAASLEYDVQRELKRRGYYSGPLDGDIGPGSRNAIRAYQADRGLSVTGRIDSRLLRSLGI
jgi:hypothetical protein